MDKYLCPVQAPVQTRIRNLYTLYTGLIRTTCSRCLSHLYFQTSLWSRFCGSPLYSRDLVARMTISLDENEPIVNGQLLKAWAVRCDIRDPENRTPGMPAFHCWRLTECRVILETLGTRPEWTETVGGWLYWLVRTKSWVLLALSIAKLLIRGRESKIFPKWGGWSKDYHPFVRHTTNTD